MVGSLKMKKAPSFFESPYWPAFLSGLVAPGLGQIINREMSKGVLLLAASMGSLFWFSRVVTDQLTLLLPGNPEQWQQDQAALKEAIMSLVNQNPGMFFTFHILIATVWIFGIVDAYLTAKRQRKNDQTQRRRSPEA